jgi:hypothetical protein
MAIALKESAEAQGYDFTLYKVGREVVNTELKVNGKSKYFYVGGTGKPTVIEKALKDYEGDLVFLDADCLIKKPFGDVLYDCDVAVTLKRIKERDKLKFFEAYTNTGVIFFKNNENSNRFLKMWKDNFVEDNSFECLGTDQAAINRLLLKYSLLDKFEIIDVDGIKVKLLTTDEYNFFYFKEDDSKAKIIHYKGMNFRKHPAYQKKEEYVNC